MRKNIKKHHMFKVSEIALSYKSSVAASERPKVISSLDAYNLVMAIWDKNTIQLIEQCKVLFLNRNNNVLGIYELSSGGITGTVVDLRLIFAAALKMRASGIIISHNHPSGDIKPSLCDQEITTRVKEAGKLLDTRLLDHLIVTPFSYYSFADDGFV